MGRFKYSEPCKSCSVVGLRRSSIDNSGTLTHRGFSSTLHFCDEISLLAVTDSCLEAFENESWVVLNTLNHVNQGSVGCLRRSSISNSGT